MVSVTVKNSYLIFTVRELLYIIINAQDSKLLIFISQVTINIHIYLYITLSVKIYPNMYICTYVCMYMSIMSNEGYF